MLFNSISFVVYFPVIVIFYFSLPYRYRWILLLIASYYFYMCWKPEYALLLFISTSIDYFAGLYMGKTEDKRKRTKYLILSILSNMSILFFFKYFNFFNGSLRAVFNHYNLLYNIPYFKLLLPVGISFYTFQSLSYGFDVYRGAMKPEKHFGIFALYVSFFPQLVAGPIERSTRLLPQFYEKHDFSYNNIIEGAKLMLWGFCKKVVIADRLATYVNRVYGNPSDFGSIPIIIASYFFAFQIYCDFSGYSDIARGGATMMGYRLMNNFRLPHFATSMPEFWKRWHLSLTTWFKDYLYFPLGGSRCSKPRHYFNMFTVFALAGLWHGANWTYVIWGIVHGTYVVLSHLTKRIRDAISHFFGIDRSDKLKKIVGVFLTFHIYLTTVVFFRAQTFSDIVTVIKRVLSFNFLQGGYMAVYSPTEMSVALLSILFLNIVQLIQIRYGTDYGFLTKEPAWVRRPIYIIIVLALIAFGKFNAVDFIYFQF